MPSDAETRATLRAALAAHAETVDAVRVAQGDLTRAKANQGAAADALRLGTGGTDAVEQARTSVEQAEAAAAAANLNEKRAGNVCERAADVVIAAAQATWAAQAEAMRRTVDTLLRDAAIPVASALFSATRAALLTDPGRPVDRPQASTVSPWSTSRPPPYPAHLGAQR
jgi:hypothetical protein